MPSCEASLRPSRRQHTVLRRRPRHADKAPRWRDGCSHVQPSTELNTSDQPGPEYLPPTPTNRPSWKMTAWRNPAQGVRMELHCEPSGKVRTNAVGLPPSATAPERAIAVGDFHQRTGVWMRLSDGQRNTAPQCERAQYRANSRRDGLLLGVDGAHRTGVGEAAVRPDVAPTSTAVPRPILLKEFVID